MRAACCAWIDARGRDVWLQKRVSLPSLGSRPRGVCCCSLQSAPASSMCTDGQWVLSLTDHGAQVTAYHAPTDTVLIADTWPKTQPGALHVCLHARAAGRFDVSLRPSPHHPVPGARLLCAIAPDTLAHPCPVCVSCFVRHAHFSAPHTPAFSSLGATGGVAGGNADNRQGFVSASVPLRSPE